MQNPIEFSKKSRRAVLIFVGLFACVVLFPRVFFLLKDEARIAFHQTDFEKKQFAKTQFEKRKYAPKEKKKSKFSAPTSKFDPNQYQVKDWMKLGLSEKQANVVLSFGKRKFYSNEDLKRVFVINEELFSLLKDSTIYPDKNQNYTNPFIEKKEVENKKVSIEINDASEEDLMKIKGIGSGYAKRIIKFRDMLGGFANAEQIRETYGLPPETVEEILKYGFLKSGVRKLKINQISLADFRHPYVKYFQAKAIIAYRDQHGAFKNAEDLKQIKILDEATILKISPYIEF
jgi:competence ComEA-like helix-hairpin-helix protein